MAGLRGVTDTEIGLGAVMDAVRAAWTIPLGQNNGLRQYMSSSDSALLIQWVWSFELYNWNASNLDDSGSSATQVIVIDTVLMFGTWEMMYKRACHY